MANNEDDKKKDGRTLREWADVYYGMGHAMGGNRPTGGFASMLGGLVSYGTHRDGRPGVLLAGKFVPITRKAALDYGFDSSLYGKGDGGGGGGGGGGNNQKTLIKPFKPFQPKLPLNAGWDRTIQKYLKPPGGGNKDNSTQSRGLFTGRAKIGNMKEGGLVRGAGKAERGRGRGKMV